MKNIIELISGIILLALIIVPMALAAFIVAVPMGIAFVCVLLLGLIRSRFML